ncbi:MAG: hypothetical protein DMG05_08510 [Acidobacteria bacterium]|nr:MAG: hypothetical protein DMG05_08510 [Acidobacteriota bacterium]
MPKIHIHVFHPFVWSITTVLLLLGISLLPRNVLSQEPYGTILGTVTDSSGAVIPDAQVQITNTATNVSTQVVTNPAGNYRVPYLTPGHYAVTVERAGFKKYVRSGLELRVAATLEVNPSLELGEATQQIEVTEETPLLSVADGSRGAVIDRAQLQELPIRDGSAAELIVLTPGISNTTDLRPRKAAFSQGISLVSTNGAGEARNDFTVDGIPNVVAGGPGGGAEDASSFTKVGVAFPSEAIQELVVQTNVYSATQGHTPGGVFNMVTRAGTNEFHGEAHEFLKNRALNSNDFYSRMSDLPKSNIKDNRYGFSIGGPVAIPKFYDGHNKTFFFFSFENNPFASPFTSLNTIPTPEQLRGDFSALLALGPEYQIYDPKSITFDGEHYKRTPFPNNIIPVDRFDPVAKRLLTFWPAPNVPAATPDGRLNYFFNNPDTGDWYRTYTTRVDHAFSGKHRIFGRLTLDKWRSVKDNFYQNDSTGLETNRVSRLVGVDDVYMFSSNVVLNVRGGFLRQPSTRGPRVTGIDYGTLDFSSDLPNLIPEQPLAFPVISLGRYQGFGTTAYFVNNNSSESVTGMLSWQKGQHNLRFGAEFRSVRQFVRNEAGAHAPGISFSQQFTKGPDELGAGQPIGGELAAFLLGVPSGGSMTIPVGFNIRSNWYGFFLHDDWKVTPRLTLNLGLRYELELPMTERDNRVVIGFDRTTPLDIDAAARAAYAQNPIPELPVNQFAVRGGYQYATASNRGAWKRDPHNIMPRFGLAYRLGDKTVVRGGFGLYFDQLGVGRNNYLSQPGFRRTTPVIPTNDFGQNYIASLSNPFPDGRLLQPVGSSLGVNLDAGNSLSYVGYENARNPYTMQWSFGFQRELPGGFVLDTSYVGSKSVGLPVDITTLGTDINTIPRQYLSTLPTRDQANLDFLLQPVANPFTGLLPGTDLDGAEIPRMSLLVPYPQFQSIPAIKSGGMSWYHSWQTRVERRMRGGFTLLGNYTWSKNMKANSYLNPTDTRPEHVIEYTDPGQVFSMSGVYELPFGRGRHWGSSWHGVVNHIFGGWQMSSVFKAQRGMPAWLGDGVLLPGKTMYDAILPKSQRTWDGGWFSLAPFDTNFDIQPDFNHIRTLSSRFNYLRGPGYWTLDGGLTKKFAISERVQLQFRSEFYNLTNNVNQGQWVSLVPGDNWPGYVEGYLNGTARVIQLGLRLSF